MQSSHQFEYQALYIHYVVSFAFMNPRMCTVGRAKYTKMPYTLNWKAILRMFSARYIIGKQSYVCSVLDT